MFSLVRLPSYNCCCGWALQTARLPRPGARTVLRIVRTLIEHPRTLRHTARTQKRRHGLYRRATDWRWSTRGEERAAKLRHQALPRDWQCKSRHSRYQGSEGPVTAAAMPTLEVNNFNIVCATLGGFITLFGLVSYLMKEKFYLSEACESRSPALAQWSMTQWHNVVTSSVHILIHSALSNFSYCRPRLLATWHQLDQTRRLCIQ